MTHPMYRAARRSSLRPWSFLGSGFAVLSFALVLIGPVAPAAAQQAAAPAEPAPPPDYVIIVHSDNPAQSVDKGRLSKMFLKKIKRWEDSELSVEPYDLLEDSEVREAFTRAVHNKNISAIKSFWQRMIFSGRDVPPDEMEDDETMMATVAKDQGAVGYVAGTTKLIDGVKILEVTDE